MRTTFKDPLLDREEVAQIREVLLCNDKDARYYAQLDQQGPTGGWEAKEFTVRATKLTKQQKLVLQQYLDEVYLLRGHLLKKLYQGENPWRMRPWLINTYTVNNGVRDVEKEIKYLEQNMIEYLLDDIRRLYDLVQKSKVSEKIYLSLNPPQQNCLMLSKYGFSHKFISPGVLRLMGVRGPVHLVWPEQLNEFETIQYGNIKIKQVDNNYYITFYCVISTRELNQRANYIINRRLQKPSSTLDSYEDPTNKDQKGDS